MKNTWQYPELLQYARHRLQKEVNDEEGGNRVFIHCFLQFSDHVSCEFIRSLLGNVVCIPVSNTSHYQCIGCLDPNNMSDLYEFGCQPDNCKIITKIGNQMRKNSGVLPSTVSLGYQIQNAAKLSMLQERIDCIKDGEDDFKWIYPEADFPLPEKFNRWFELISTATPGTRLPALILLSIKRKWGKSSFIASMVGHPKGDNDFGKNPYIIYVSRMASKDCFNKPLAKLIILDDYRQWDPSVDDL